MSILSGPAALLGIGKDHGDYYENRSLNNRGTQSLAEILNATRSANVGTTGKSLMGGASLKDAIANLSPDELGALASSPVFGNIVASMQAESDPLLSGLIGKGGSRDQALAEEKRLSSQGFQLTPEDREAYGQVSGDIARQFGKQEQSLSQTLSRRGLGSASSGASGAAFTGLQGSKNEQLASMQMNIANNRMNNTMQRLQQTRSYLSQMGNLGLNAENSAHGHNMDGSTRASTYPMRCQRPTEMITK